MKSDVQSRAIAKIEMLTNYGSSLKKGQMVECHPVLAKRLVALDAAKYVKTK